MPFTVSAPGKVILFGEHAVVYGVPAIAGAVSLRTYCGVDNYESNDQVELDFPDVDLRFSIRVSEIPFNLAKEESSKDNSLNETLFEALTSTLDNWKLDSFSYKAALAFLYIYACIGPGAQGGYRFTVRSGLPIGAGLGSSAGFSVCLATAIMHIADRPLKKEELLHWSFMGECCIHGKPSGIDNAVAVYGGAVHFSRVQGKPASLVPYSNIPSTGLLLVDTHVPRMTSELVNHVSNIKKRWPRLFDSLMDTMKAVTLEADELLAHPLPVEDLTLKLGELASINHGMLVGLGVSHPALEEVRHATAELGLGNTKLTGAGGGGCAITLLHDDSVSIDALQSRLKGFNVIKTAVGGPGVGVCEVHSIPKSLEEFKALPWTYPFNKE